MTSYLHDSWLTIGLPDAYAYMEFNKTLLSIARAEMRAGAREIGGNNRGPFVAKYLEPSGLKPPQPWCAAFVSWCLMRAAKAVGARRPPYFLSAREMFNWAKAAGLLEKQPSPGGLVFFARGGVMSWKGHCGVVAATLKSGFQTIEGNRTSRVQLFRYTTATPPLLLGFIGTTRLPDALE